MPGMDKPTGRVAALIALLLLVAAALRGYLPAHHHAARSETGGRIALVFVVSVLAVTLALVAIAVIARLRDPRAPAPRPGELSELLGTGKGRPSWRVVLIGLAVIAAWLLLVMLLARLWGPHGIGSAPPSADHGAPPAPTTAPPQPQGQQRPHGDSGDVFGFLLAGTVLMLMMIVAGAVGRARRQWRPAPPSIADESVESAAPPTRSETLARAAERGLAEMTDLSREPREAIIACYAAMERELANVPGAAPRDFDTPTEVLARAVEHHALHADNAIQLVNLFAEARFSPHVMNEGHRDEAARVLRLVLDELESRSAA